MINLLDSATLLETFLIFSNVVDTLLELSTIFFLETFNILVISSTKIFIFSKRKLNEKKQDYIFSAISELEGDFTEEIILDLGFVVVETIPSDLAPYGSVVFAFVE